MLKLVFEYLNLKSKSIIKDKKERLINIFNSGDAANIGKNSRQNNMNLYIKSSFNFILFFDIPDVF